ncbi:MAG TPA: carboxypeptidase-like regulatory domain-containing protein [Pirellulales bacterium]|jgi:hypothetical protein|nr:carboxypeptidase-like regulatory domain-containing protein [Pirellulales bacterium]
MNARILRQAAVGIAALGLSIPPTLLSAAQSPATELPSANAPLATISDVALAAGGTLRGQVVDAAGGAMPGVNVMIRQQDNVIARTSTDPAGKFEVAGMPGGVFQISTDRSEGSFRLWAPETAPPGARPAVLVVHDSVAVRGQSAIGRLLSRPLAMATIVASAVAIPIVIHQVEIERKSGS